MNKLFFFFLLLFYSVCYSDTLFTLMNPKETGIDFRNDVIEREDLNIITEGQNYVYSGAGVAIGDINKDGLSDILLVSNQNTSRLYLNKGNLTFKDITLPSNIFTNNWCTGAIMADVNGDGWLDIYISSYGYPVMDSARCWLYINNKNNTFSERSSAFGIQLNNTNVSQVAFFDYDLDGDLDMYATIYPSKYIDEINFDFENRYPIKIGSDKLFENIENNFFSDISEKAGIISENAYGLSILTTDINNDGWIDIYVANDFAFNDFLYINQKDGTFKESVKDYFKHTSFYSMGTDIGDINGDLLPDIVELDMTPESNQKYKIDFHEFSFDLYRKTTQTYMRQEIRNNLQLNLGNNKFSEIGQSAGIDATDWSWTPLIRDFNLDGKNDIFITNGIKRDVLNSNYFFWTYDSIRLANNIINNKDEKVTMLSYVPRMALMNYYYENVGNFKFKNLASSSGLSQITTSNGAAYADLDLDGDDDLVVNNMDDFAFIYRNNSKNRNFFSLQVIDTNRLPVNNCKFLLYEGSQKHYFESLSQRGFYSTSENRFITGVESDKIDSLILILPANNKILLYDLPINKSNVFQMNKDVIGHQINKIDTSTIFDTLSLKTITPIDNDYIDFKHQPLLLQKYSKNGPVAAVTKAGIQNLFYFGTPKGNPKFIYNMDSLNKLIVIQELINERNRENTDAIFVDINSDKYKDLLISSGSGEINERSNNIGVHLYKNVLNKKFIEDTTFPQINYHIKKIIAIDYDNDKDLDLVLFPLIDPDQYPKPASITFLKNANGRFIKDIKLNNKFKGNFQDAETFDWNNDGRLDIIAVGHWMSPEIYINKPNVGFVKKVLSDTLKGYWSAVDILDLDDDGINEIYFGNIGNNWRYNQMVEDSLVMFIKDINKDGLNDPIVCTAEKGKFYPIYLYNDFLQSFPFVKKNVLQQVQYSNADITQIFSNFKIKENPFLVCNYQKSVRIISEDKVKHIEELPLSFQQFPINKFFKIDKNQKSYLMLLGQNTSMRDEIGPMDATNTSLYLYTNKQFEYTNNSLSGINVINESLNALPLDKGKKHLIISKNSKPLLMK